MARIAHKLAGWPLACALGLTLILAATINGESLWTDEAFSAYIASHRNLSSLWSTLLHGDSSDLQMTMYYVYLFLWGKLFGLSEISFRTANIPFGLLFSSTLVWAGQRFFGSRVTWLVAGLSPLLWSFANDARAYFVITALGAVATAAMLAYLESSNEHDRKLAPWIVIGSLLLGATFHMLMLLLAAPLLVMLVTFWRVDSAAVRWNDWKAPLAWLAPLALLEAAFFAWTFGRGAPTQYAHPDAVSMAAVLFRFAGLSGYYPNRRYDIPFRPYLPLMVIASVVFLIAIVALVLAAKRSTHQLSFRALGYALAVGILQVFAMSVAIKQQAEVRHLAALLPLFLFLIMAGLSFPGSAKWGNAAKISFVLIAGLWLLSDARLTFLPEYKREDFRAAVFKAIAVSGPIQADVAVVADPIAADYYGLAMRGEEPCFPLTDSCQDGFAKVSWKTKQPAVYAAAWTPEQISGWMQLNRKIRKPKVVLISRTRHPMYKNSAWWNSLQYLQYSKLYLFHGFYIFVFFADTPVTASNNFAHFAVVPIAGKQP